MLGYTHTHAQCMLGYTHSPAQCMLGYGQQAGVTYPTGMHSCFIKDLIDSEYAAKNVRL